MGYIAFRTRHTEVLARGSERAHIGILLGELTQAILMPRDNQDLLLQAIPDDHYLVREKKTQTLPLWADTFRTSFAVSNLLAVNGEIIDSFILTLNTALATGNDAVKLAAAIHGQCEVNGFIRGKNRAWMADIIANDKSGFFREGKGWEETVDFLRESDEETVFMSYSVTNDVLSRVQDEWQAELASSQDLDIDDADVESDLYDAWEALGEDKQWEMVEKWADENAYQGFELSPERWADREFAFGNGWNASKLIKTLEENYLALQENQPA